MSQKGLPYRRLVRNQACFWIGFKGLNQLEDAFRATFGLYLHLSANPGGKRAIFIGMHVWRHNLSQRNQMLQLQDLALNFGLFIFSIFISATLADIASFFGFMDIISNFFALHRAQILYPLLPFRKAFRRQTNYFTLGLRITLSTNTHKLFSSW